MSDELKPIVEAFAVLHQAINSTSEGGLANDKALLTLSEAIAERVGVLDKQLFLILHRITEIEEKMEILNNKLNILHELYHTHFADGVTDDEETKH